MGPGARAVVSPSSTDGAASLTSPCSFQEGGAIVRGLIESTGEPLLPLTKAILAAPVRDHTAGEVWRLASRREAHKRAFMALWQEAKLDVLLCPTAPLPAPRPGRVSVSQCSSVAAG